MKRSSQLPQSLLPVIHAITVFIGVVIKGELIDVGGQLLNGVTFRLWRSGQVYAAFLADFPVMALDVGNQLTGSLIDGFQTGPQFRQLLAMAPAGDIPEAVFSSLDTEILADRIGNALGLHFLGVAVFLFGRFLVTGPGRFFLGFVVVMQLAVGGLMDDGGNGLYFAHSFTDGDTLLIGRKIAVHLGGHRFKLNGDRGRTPHRFQKRFIVRHSPGQRGSQFR